MTSTISRREMVSSGSRRRLKVGRLTMICWTRKSSELTVKSVTVPSLEPFLVSTLRERRSKLRPRTCSIRTTSEGATNSSIESMTMP